MNLQYNSRTNEFKDITNVLMEYLDFMNGETFIGSVKYGFRKPNETNKAFFNYLSKEYKWKYNKKSEQSRKIIALVNFLSLAECSAKNIDMPNISDLDREDLFIYLAEGEIKRELRNLKAKANSVKQMHILNVAIRLQMEMYEKAMKVKQAQQVSNKRIEEMVKEAPKTEGKTSETSSSSTTYRREIFNEMKESVQVKNKADTVKEIIEKYLKALEKSNGKVSAEKFAKDYAKSKNVEDKNLDRISSNIATSVAVISTANALANKMAIDLNEAEKRGMMSLIGNPNFVDVINAVKESATSEFEQSVVQSTIQIAEQLRPYAIEEQVAVFEANLHLTDAYETIRSENLVHNDGPEMER